MEPHYKSFSLYFDHYFLHDCPEDEINWACYNGIATIPFEEHKNLLKDVIEAINLLPNNQLTVFARSLDEILLYECIWQRVFYWKDNKHLAVNWDILEHSSVNFLCTCIY